MAILKFEGIEINTDDVVRDDMPNELFCEVFDLCGAETAVSLLNFMQGNIIHVPTQGMAKIASKLIRKQYDGSTASLRQICRKFKITEANARKILTASRVNVPAEGQKEFDFYGGKENAE